MPALLSFLIKAPADDLAGALAAGGDSSRACLRAWLARQRIRAPSARTFARVFTGLDARAFNAALCGYLGSLPASPADALPAVTRREREQRRAVKARPDPPGLLHDDMVKACHLRRPRCARYPIRYRRI